VLKESVALVLKDVKYAIMIRLVSNVLLLKPFTMVTVYLHAQLELYNQGINVLIAMFLAKLALEEIITDVILAQVHTNYSMENVYLPAHKELSLMKREFVNHAELINAQNVLKENPALNALMDLFY